jgi:hypothetical protein
MQRYTLLLLLAILAGCSGVKPMLSGVLDGKPTSSAISINQPNFALVEETPPPPSANAPGRVFGQATTSSPAKKVGAGRMAKPAVGSTTIVFVDQTIFVGGPSMSGGDGGLTAMMRGAGLDNASLRVGQTVGEGVSPLAASSASGTAQEFRVLSPEARAFVDEWRPLVSAFVVGTCFAMFLVWLYTRHQTQGQRQS